jgi:hypothetical protein
MTRLHGWNQNLLLALIALHVLAVLAYLLVKRENLIVPMLNGRKRGAAADDSRFASGWLALGLFAACAAVVGAAAYWLGG